MRGRAAGVVVAALAVLAGSTTRDDAATPSLPAECAAPPGLVAVGPALRRLAQRIAHGQTVTIVALGSSSTEGIGASAPGSSYPSRLEAELRKRVPNARIRVLNRGKGGEEAQQMVARIDRDVVAAHPDLVVWQLGTNAVLRHEDVAFEKAVIERGLARLKASGVDVVLMDMQYAPLVVARPAYTAMERLIAEAAKRDRVGLFRRFAIMRHWRSARAGEPRMLGPDRLHMNDRGYSCLAVDLAEAVAANWRAQEAARHPSAAFAGLDRPAEDIAPEADDGL